MRSAQLRLCTAVPGPSEEVADGSRHNYHYCAEIDKASPTSYNFPSTLIVYKRQDAQRGSEAPTVPRKGVGSQRASWKRQFLSLKRGQLNFTKGVQCEGIQAKDRIPLEAERELQGPC